VVQYIEKRGLYHPGAAGRDELLPGTGVRFHGSPDRTVIAGPPATPAPYESGTTTLPDDPATGDDTSPDLQEMPR
jgi:nicotinate-nucleotide adenylyltransferase